MSKKYQYENLLRKPYELVSRNCYFLAAALLFIASEYFLMPFWIAVIGAMSFIILGCLKWRKGRKFVKYQKSLIYIRPFVRSSKQIGTSKEYLWIGKGFMWGQKHAQRMHELSLSKNAHFIENPIWYKRFRAFERKTEHSRFLLKMIRDFTKSNSIFNPYPPVTDLGGKFHLHGVGTWEGEEDIVMPLANRNGHTLVLGTTRVGKTRLSEVFISQDIRRGDVVIVLDPKGDADLLLRMYAECKASNREEDFHIFHLGYPDVSESYNPIGSFMRETEVASRIAGQMPSEGQSAAFKDFVWGYVNTISVALIKMGIVPNLMIIKTYSADLQSLFDKFMEWYFDQRPEVKSFWEKDVEMDEAQLSLPAAERSDDFKKSFKPSRIMASYTPRTQALYKFYQDHVDKIQSIESDMLMSKINYDKNHLDKLTASLQPFLDKLTTGELSKLLIPDPTSDKPSFNWNDVIQNGGVVYVGLDALSDPEVGGAVGNSMLADLTSVAGRIYKEGVDHGLPTLKNDNKTVRKICLHADEVNELIGPEFVPLLNKSGGAGVQVTAYTQTFPDIESKIGSKAKAEQIIGNLNTLIMLRVLDDSTVKLITNRHRKVQVVTTDTISGAADSDLSSENVFTSSVTQRSTYKETDLINPEDILSLPIGQAYVEVQGNRLFKVRMPLPDPKDLANIPDDIKTLSEDMRKSYRSSDKALRQARPLINMPALTSQDLQYFTDNSSFFENEREEFEKKYQQDDTALSALDLNHSTDDMGGVF